MDRKRVQARLACRTCLAACLILAVATLPCRADGVRIKDITELEGARANQLVGIGLVVGLNGTGSKSAATQQAAVDMLQRFQISTKTISTIQGDAVLKSGNIALVTVTAELGPFSRQGTKIDVTVAALDDSASLLGGILIQTPLRGADLVDYAVAQGPLSVGGFSFSTPGGSPGGNPSGGTTASAQKNHPTVGRIPNGAFVERAALGRIMCNGQMRLLLRDPDFYTSRAIAQAINARFPDTALSLDAGSVQIFVPSTLCSDVVAFASDIGLLEVNTDTVAKVIINERNGTIIAGHHVRVSAVAVTHGNIAIVTSNQPIASQPNPFSKGKTVVLPRSQLGVTEQGGPVLVLEQTMSVGELARALNALGASPRDLILIFQGLKSAGALHADLIVN